MFSYCDHCFNLGPDFVLVYSEYCIPVICIDVCTSFISDRTLYWPKLSVFISHAASLLTLENQWSDYFDSPFDKNIRDVLSCDWKQCVYPPLCSCEECLMWNSFCVSIVFCEMKQLLFQEVYFPTSIFSNGNLLWLCIVLGALLLTDCFLLSFKMEYFLEPPCIMPDTCQKEVCV